MNALIDRFPTALEVAGKEYGIDADFRTCLRIILAFEDAELTDMEKQFVMLKLLFQETPHDLEAAAAAAVRFINCGEDTGKGSGSDEARLYSFEHDAKYIFAAVKQSHGIDLETVDFLHWWKFSYLFLDLHEDCFFCKLLYLRKQKAKGQLTKAEREWYASIRDIVDLPVALSSGEQDVYDEFMRLYNGG